MTIARPIRWVLLDRDGTINRKASDGDYVKTPDEVELLPGAARAIRLLNEAAIPIAVVTNQRGIDLGVMNETDLDAVNGRLTDLLGTQGARVDLILHCPHGLDKCGCRKPSPQLLLQASRSMGLDPVNAVMIGDSDSDVQAGRNAGCRTIRLTVGEDDAADGTAGSLIEAVEAMVLGEWAR